MSSVDHWIIFLLGVIAGALAVYLRQFVDEMLERRAWDWYDDDYLTGVEARRRLFRGDDDV